MFAWGIFICASDTTKLFIPNGFPTKIGLLLSCKYYLDAIGAFFYTTVLTPFTAMKLRLISEPLYNNSITKLLKDLQRKNNSLMLYSGYLISLFYIFEGIIHLALYEELKKGYTDYYSFFFLGVFSRFIAISLTYPYRVIFAIVQSRSISVSEAFNYAIKTSGIYGLYKGYSACIYRNLPPSGFLFMFLEILRNVLTHLIHSI